MKNKKGQIQVWIILGILLIGGLGFGWFSSNKNCDEKLLQEKEISDQLRNQLSKAKLDLDNANKIIGDKNKQINDLSNELNFCESPEPEITHETFNLFWSKNIEINKFWNFMINLSFGITLFSLFRIALFSRKKRRGMKTNQKQIKTNPTK
jgi:hypothetical protein